MMECDACKRLADRIEMDDEWAGTTLGNIKTVSPAAIAQSAPSTSLDLDTLAEFDYRFNRRYDLAAMIPAPRMGQRQNPTDALPPPEAR
jgi:hypothetical protein